MARSKFRINHLGLYFFLAGSVFLAIDFPSFAADKKESTEHFQINESGDGYTVNFNNVSIEQYVRFLSRIADVNFIYNEEDLNFNITIISEQETSLTTLLSAFAQILRIHNLDLIEDEKNLIIHKTDSIRQVPTIISDLHPYDGKVLPPILTKLFRINNANPSRIAALVTPLLSKGALVEVATETRQLIVTDVAGSVENLAVLIENLDAPETPYEVAPYVSKNSPIVEISLLCKEIVSHMTDGVPIALVPQKQTNTLYVVSTPFLIEKTLAILDDLDKPPRMYIKGSPFGSDNVLLYQIKHRSSSVVEQAIKQIVKGTKEQGIDPGNIDEVVEKMRYIPSTHSLLFVGNPKTLAAIQALLSRIDAKDIGENSDTSNYFLFEPKKMSLGELLGVLKEINANFKHSEFADPSLTSIIDGVQPIYDINSAFFVGSTRSITALKPLLESIETSYMAEQQGVGPVEFFVYSIKNAREEQIRTSLKNLSEYLSANDYPNKDLIHAIDSMKWIKISNSILFTGHKTALDELKELLPTFDVPPGSSQLALSQLPPSTDFILYGPTHMPGQKMKEAVLEMEKNLKAADLADPAFIRALNSVHWDPIAGQLLFTGNEASLERLQKALTELDQSYAREIVLDMDFKVIRLIHANGEELIKDLRKTANQLEASNAGSKALVETLASAQWNKASNTLMITGAPQELKEAEELIATYDVPSDTEIFVYAPEYLTPYELEKALQSIADHSYQVDKSPTTHAFKRLIEEMIVVPETDSVQFVGAPLVIERLKTTIASLDTAENSQGKKKKASETNFLTYSPKRISPDDLLAELRALTKDFPHPLSSADRDVLSTINRARVAPSSNVVVFVGSQAALAKLKTLIEKLDSASKDAGPRETPEGYELYTPLIVPGTDLIQMLRTFEDHLVRAGVQDPAIAEVIDNLTYMKSANTILVSGDTEAVEKVLALLKRFDEDGSSAHMADIETIGDVSFLLYKLQHHEGDTIVSALRTIGEDLRDPKNTSPVKNPSAQLGDVIQSVRWLEVNNAIIARGSPKVLAQLKELILEIDQPLKQVFIEILVIETSIDDQLDIGLRWIGQGKYLERLGIGTGNFSPRDIPSDGTPLPFVTNANAINATRTPTGSDIPPLSTGYLGVIGDIITHKGKSYLSLGSLLSAFKENGDTTVVLSQKIIAQDNRNSKIFVGENVPFTGSLVTTAGLSQTTNANLEYRNIGVTLSLTPYIGNDGVVTLDIDEEISEEQNQGTGSTGSDLPQATNVNGIRTSKTSMQTRAHLPDQHFLVLSGMVRNSTARLKSGIPCLGGLPLIGAAFSQTQKVVVKRNVIIFVKPTIIYNDALYSSITNQQEILFGSCDQSNPEDFDAGLDIVKTADDECYDEDDEDDDDDEE